VLVTPVLVDPGEQECRNRDGHLPQGLSVGCATSSEVQDGTCAAVSYPLLWPIVRVEGIPDPSTQTDTLMER
jgi:hypothetical protein